MRYLALTATGHGTPLLHEMTNTAAYSPETCHLQLRKAAKRRCESHFQPAFTASPRQDGRCGKGYTLLHIEHADESML